MSRMKKMRLVLYILATLDVAAITLWFSPLATAPPAIRWYYTLISLLYVLLLAVAFSHQLQLHWRVKHKSYLEKDSSLKKKLLPPTAQEIRAALAACFTLPRYIFAALALALAFYLDYLLVYYPRGWAGLPELLFDYGADGNIVKSNVWLAVASLCVLFLCLVIIRQNYHLKQNHKLTSRQNLIINAHSNIALGALRLIFTDINRMFLAANKLEYILNAKPLANLGQSKAQTLLNFRVTVKLNNDYSLTEFYIRQFSIFVGDLVIECDNYQNKFYQIFAVDNEFMLNFYIKFSNVDPDRLAQKFADAGSLKLYYNFVVKNSFSVITDIYGSALYEQSGEQSADNLCYITRDTKANQYFYI